MIATAIIEQLRSFVPLPTSRFEVLSLLNLLPLCMSRATPALHHLRAVSSMRCMDCHENKRANLKEAVLANLPGRKAGRRPQRHFSSPAPHFLLSLLPDV